MFEWLKNKTQPIGAAQRFPKAQWVKRSVMVDAEFAARPARGFCFIHAFKGMRRDLTP